MSEDISIAEVRHMAQLSRLIIDANEEKLFAHQFGQIIGHMNVLNQVNTEGIEPLYSPCQYVAPTREDETYELRTRQEILSNAPETDGEHFLVPRIV